MLGCAFWVVAVQRGPFRITRSPKSKDFSRDAPEPKLPTALRVIPSHGKSRRYYFGGSCYESVGDSL